ncbi:microcephalin-like isoform X2 [Centruroides sculpturatus]|uniref:microcephalin-like isoform X2 n=1 Tax=Centruroides sculpturatus TaxID=218467 RepID=UPI000C6E26D5|nr:microcephalin-like isoform X2 [Centruroides sculpturatus]
MNQFNPKEEFTYTKVDTGQIEHIRETTLLHDLTQHKELIKNNTENSPLKELHSLFVQNLNITEIFAPTKSNRKDLDYKSAETFKISSVLQCENNVNNPKEVEFKNKFPSASSEMVGLARTYSLQRSKSTTDKCLIRNKDKTDHSVAETPSVAQGFICPNYLHKGTKIRENTGKDKDKNLDLLDSNIINESKDHSANDFLKDVIAYVEVRSGRENRSKVVENRLQQMGAKIVPRIRKSTTHVIFKEGRKSTRDIAVKKGIHLVSVLWVESCRQRKCHVPESEYPANIPEVYDTPLFGNKFQKLNYMQSKDFDAKVARSLERFEKVLMRAQRNNERFKTEGSFIESEACCSTKECARCDANNGDVNCLKCRLFYSLPKDIKTNSQNTELNNEADNKNEEQKNKTAKRRRKLFSELNGPPKWITQSPDVSENRDVFPTSGKVNEAQLSSVRRNEMDESDKFEESPFVKVSKYSRCSLDDFIIIKNKRKLCAKEKPKINKCVPKRQSGDQKLADDSVSSRSLVLTGFQQRDQETLIPIAKSLGGFCIIPQVNDTTTHVICADNRRTLNVLFGIVRGCWLLSSDWVFESMESGNWLNEEPYELSETFPAARVNRMQKASKGAAYQSHLFQHLGNIFVSAYCAPEYNKLTELITLTGGKIITSFQKCQTVVGPMKHCDESKNRNILHIKEKWILDCISQHKVLPYDSYKYERSPH